MQDTATHYWHHWFDTKDNPEGGHSFGLGYAIAWQRGPLGRGAERREPNGAFVEDVLSAVIDRVESYQRSKFACEENAEALRCMYAARSAMNRRTRDREARNVEGTHAK